METAVSYLRVSGASQLEGDGFPRQREAIGRRAKAMGLELVEEFRDEGVSGTTPFAERPGLMAALVRLQANGCRILMVERADRLARDLVEGELVLRECRRLGVQVIEAEGGNDLTAGDDSNPTAKLIRQVLGAVAEFEKSALVSKLRAGRLRKRKAEGRCEGQVPFGEKPGEDEVVRTIRRLHRKSPLTGKRRSLQDIADELDKAGIKPRRGEKWSRSTLFEILKRPRPAKQS